MIIINLAINSLASLFLFNNLGRRHLILISFFILVCVLLFGIWQ